MLRRKTRRFSGGPLEHLPDGYTAIDLVDNTSNRYVTGDHRTRIRSTFDPVYLALGSNIIQLTRQPDESRMFDSCRPAQSYAFINILNDGRLDVPSDEDSIYGNAIVIGRDTAPGLQLDSTGSSRHLSFESMVNTVVLQCLDLNKGTVVYTRDVQGAVTKFGHR